MGEWIDKFKLFLNETSKPKEEKKEEQPYLEMNAKKRTSKIDQYLKDAESGK